MHETYTSLDELISRHDQWHCQLALNDKWNWLFASEKTIKRDHNFLVTASAVLVFIIL